MGAALCVAAFYASMVEMVRVVSSRTSSRADTGSSAVNMVTLYSRPFRRAKEE